MSGDEIREERIGETVRELADAYMRTKEHILVLASWRNARATGATGGGDAEGDTDLDAREHAEGLINDLVLLQRFVNRAAKHPDVVAKLPSSTMASAENTIRSALGAAAMVDGVNVPSYEELQVVAEEDPLMWMAQYERLSTYYDRAEGLFNKVDAASESLDERGMLLAVTDLDDFIEDLDREDDLRGRRTTVELRGTVALNRERLASRLNDGSSTGHVVARRWTTEDDA